LDDLSPPSHLAKATQRWWLEVTKTYDLGSHHVKLLTLAAEAWDRAQQARKAIAADGAYSPDRFGQPRAHPALAVERDSRLAFARLIRELNLDDDHAPDSRPPLIPGRYASS